MAVTICRHVMYGRRLKSKHNARSGWNVKGTDKYCFPATSVKTTVFVIHIKLHTDSKTYCAFLNTDPASCLKSGSWWIVCFLSVKRRLLLWICLCACMPVVFFCFFFFLQMCLWVVFYPVKLTSSLGHLWQISSAVYLRSGPPFTQTTSVK